MRDFLLMGLGRDAQITEQVGQLLRGERNEKLAIYSIGAKRGFVRCVSFPKICNRRYDFVDGPLLEWFGFVRC